MLSGTSGYRPRSGDRVNVTRVWPDGSSQCAQGVITFDAEFTSATRFRLNGAIRDSADGARYFRGITQTITPVPVDGVPDV